MSSAGQSGLVLMRLSADGTVEWIPLETPAQHVPVVADDAYALIDRANYEAPQALVVKRVGKDLVVDVHGQATLVLDGFFTAEHVEFYPTTNIAGGAGPFSGPALTADSLAVADYVTGELVLWSADHDESPGPETVTASAATVAGASQGSGDSAPLLWAGLAAGGLGLAALAGGGGGSGGGGESGGVPPPNGGGGGSTPPPGGGGGGSTPPPDATAPQITSGTTASPITENSGAGQVVYTASATDNSTVTYSLNPSGDATAFSINPNTGAVTLTANPDFEAKPSYTFTVVAADAAGNHSERTVSLAINNVDDAGPTITSGGTAPAINENSGAGRVVYAVTSTDTGPTTYSLKQVNDFAAFTINANTGAVTLTGNPDAEAKSSYSFTVVATDLAGNHSERAVSLAINNLDEVAPTITSGGAASAIQENSGPNQIVYTVTSTDTADVSTGQTTYSLKPVDDSAAFNIDANTGAVTLVANPDFETNSSYSFTVVATDAAHNSSEQPISLQIIDVADTGPPDTTPPALSVSTPTDGARDVPVGQNIVLVFSENVEAGSGTITVRTAGDNRTIDVTDVSQVSVSGNQVTINPTSDLNFNGNYEVRVAAGAFTDLAGNPFAGLEGPDALHFRTARDSANLVLEAFDSGRVFQTDPSPVIDIRVDTSSTAADAAIWSGSANLGSNDRVMLVANAADMGDPTTLPNPLSIIETAVTWQPDSNGLIEGNFQTHSAHELSVPVAHDAIGGHAEIAHVPIAMTSQGLA